MEMSAITVLIAEIGGAVFFGPEVLRDVASDIDFCLEFWNVLVPRAGQMFLERIYPNGLVG
jgi:hypothetical protein